MQLNAIMLYHIEFWKDKWGPKVFGFTNALKFFDLTDLALGFVYFKKLKRTFFSIKKINKK